MDDTPAERYQNDHTSFMVNTSRLHGVDSYDIMATKVRSPDAQSVLQSLLLDTHAERTWDACVLS